jgi:hypothetical protein
MSMADTYRRAQAAERERLLAHLEPPKASGRTQQMPDEKAKELIRGKSLFLATPMYGGMNCWRYCHSVCSLSELCILNDVKMARAFVYNQALVHCARNTLVDNFLRSGCTHLLFIDADVGFDPNDALLMLALMSDDSPYDVLGVATPLKTIAWNKVKLAAEKGEADQDANRLADFAGDLAFNAIAEGNVSIPLDRPAEVSAVGTGFMMIRRSIFSEIERSNPQQRILDHEGKEITAYFDHLVDPVSRRQLSEDFTFCRFVRNSGGRVWLCPWMKVEHVGTYVFRGSLEAHNKIGATRWN